MRKSADISPSGTFRYSLGRRWSELPPLIFIGLNPSTADAEVDDPTIRRCMGFARREGAGGLIMLNLFAFRATKPADLLRAPDPMGPSNLDVIRLLTQPYRTVAAWGASGGKMADAAITRLRPIVRGPLWCLGRTKGGHPRHPLYVKASTPLEVYWEHRPV